MILDLRMPTLSYLAIGCIAIAAAVLIHVTNRIKNEWGEVSKRHSITNEIFLAIAVLVIGAVLLGIDLGSSGEGKKKTQAAAGTGPSSIFTRVESSDE